jgi:hypothetical protein
MQLMVDDRNAGRARKQSLNLETEFRCAAAQAPAIHWDLRIAISTDPSGVLWQVVQRRPGRPQDQ